MNKIFIRSVMLFLYDSGLNGIQCAEKICSVYGTNAITTKVCQKWFSRFKEGARSVEELTRSRRPSDNIDDQLWALAGEDPKLTVCELSNRRGQKPLGTVYMSGVLKF